MCKTFNNNIVKLTTLGDDEVEKVNINKLKEYHFKNVVANIMVVNVHVEKYPSKYHWGRTSTAVLKNLFRLVPKPRRLPWTDSIPKIVDDEYFWKRKKDQEVVRERQEVVVTKLNLKKLKSLYPTNYALREKDHKVICNHLT